ncbi:MAG: amidohydrolase family protein [Candidatus Thorarchaeota archaeon]
MVTICANALVGSDLEFVQGVYIQVDEQGIIVEINKEKKPTTYQLPSSYILIPGFINAHTHVADAFLKDYAYGLSLEDSVGPEGKKHMKLNSSTIDEQRESIQNSLEMLVKNGYTTFFDFREQGLVGVNLLKNLLSNFPLRGIIFGRSITDVDLEEVFNESDGLGFVDVFAINKEIVKTTKSLKEMNPEKLVGIHVSESEELISNSLLKYGKRDIELVCDYSIFDYVVHATYVNEDELSLLKKNNMSVICCPISSLYYGLKFPPLGSILRKKIILGLGTDNVLSCNPDPFRLMAFTLINARYNNQKITPKEVLKSITVNPGLITKKKIGQIKEGYSADFIGINLENPNLKFSKDIYSAITMRAEPSDIGFQMYKGRLVKWKDQKS